MAKNILIFSDGTGQEGGRGQNTNIYKMFNMVEDRTHDQIAFYDRGVGKGTRVLSGSVGGRGFGRNVRDCYRYIFEHYQASDRIFLFGFSRGAATVRSLAYFIHLFGVLPHARPELIKQAWRIYQTRSAERRDELAREFLRQHHTMWVKVHFLGCYDTVAALGFPFRTGSVILDGLPGFRHRFHNFALSPSVVHACHALAIDDERTTFHPLMWDPVDPQKPTACESMKQVWFMGMHTDVGGGYVEQQLSDIPLVWMIQQAVACGLRIYSEYDVQINENENGHMHDSRGTRWTKLYRRSRRAWRGAGKPVIHASVLARTLNQHNHHDPKYAPWILDGGYDIEPWIRHEQQAWSRQAEAGRATADAAG